MLPIGEHDFPHGELLLPHRERHVLRGNNNDSNGENYNSMEEVDNNHYTELFYV